MYAMLGITRALCYYPINRIVGFNIVGQYTCTISISMESPVQNMNNQLIYTAQLLQNSAKDSPDCNIIWQALVI